MGIKDIFEYEKINTSTIRLYKEGIFYKAYDKSAYAFISQIHPYTAKIKYYKIIGENVVSIGFPQSAIEKFSAHFDSKVEEDKSLTIECEEIDSTAFENWKSTIPITETKERTQIVGATVSPSALEVIDMIKSYPLESKSPMECMMFISELKQRISNT